MEAPSQPVTGWLLSSSAPDVHQHSTPHSPPHPPPPFGEPGQHAKRAGVLLCPSKLRLSYCVPHFPLDVIRERRVSNAGQLAI